MKKYKEYKLGYYNKDTGLLIKTEIIDFNLNKARIDFANFLMVSPEQIIFGKELELLELECE